MVNLEDANLCDQHNWFTTDLKTTGQGKAIVRQQNTTLYGQASILFDRKSEVTVRLEMQDEPSSDFDFFAFVAGEDRDWEFGELEVETSEGIFTASKARCVKTGSGNETEPAYFILSPHRLELRASAQKPIYWVMPLANLLQDFMQRGEQIRQHPLRLAPDACVVEFLWQGKPAFIEPLSDYAHREKMLESGHVKHLLTAILVGEIGNNLIDEESIEAWLPHTLLRALGFATGHDVSAPWIEFRDADGKVVKRIYRRMGESDFVSGRRIIEEIIHPIGEFFDAAKNNRPPNVKLTEHHLGKFLEAVQTTPFCQTSTYYVLLHQALRAGAGGQKLEDRLGHLLRAFDRLCKDHGFRTIFLRNELAGVEKTKTVEMLDQASNEIRALASQARGRGDTTAQKALERIAKRVKAADETDCDFGTAMCRLVQHFGFHDERVMNSYLANNPIASETTWAGVLTIYRNAAVHDGYFDSSDPAFSSKNLYSMNVHLQDLLARILLVMSGYDGPYHPIPELFQGSQDYINRVKPNTPASKLGYE